MELIHKILSWSEIWAMLIPLTIMIIYRPGALYLRPVMIYVLIALVVNTAIVIIYYANKPYFPDFRYSNNFLYNTQSLARFVFFSWFFILLKQGSLEMVKKLMIVLFMLFVAVNFIFFEDYFDFGSFSGRLLSLEAAVLLLFCLQYYFAVLREDHHADRRPPSFWVVTGLSIYVVINFPIFLFYKAMIRSFQEFAIDIWDVHNISFIIFCIFLAKAFYEDGRRSRRQVIKS